MVHTCAALHERWRIRAGAVLTFAAAAPAAFVGHTVAPPVGRPTEPRGMRAPLMDETNIAITGPHGLLPCREGFKRSLPSVRLGDCHTPTNFVRSGKRRFSCVQ
jgi:hypothetical protein